MVDSSEISARSSITFTSICTETLCAHRIKQVELNTVNCTMDFLTHLALYFVKSSMAYSINNANYHKAQVIINIWFQSRHTLESQKCVFPVCITLEWLILLYSKWIFFLPKYIRISNSKNTQITRFSTLHVCNQAAYFTLHELAADCPVHCYLQAAAKMPQLSCFILPVLWRKASTTHNAINPQPWSIDNHIWLENN